MNLNRKSVQCKGLSTRLSPRLHAALSWLVITTQLLVLVTTATVTAIQPTPQMAQQAAQQVGLGDRFANAAGDLIAWAQPLWGQPKTAAAQTSAPGGVSTNLHFWYSADVGASSSQWNDRSSNGYNVTQATSANQPALTGLSNFNPAFVFDGVNDVLTNSAFAYTSDDEEYFAVVLPTTNAGTHNIVGMGKLAFANEASELRFNANKLNYGVNQSIIFDQITAATTSDGRWQLTNGNRTTAANGAIIRIDGAQVGSGTINNVASGLNYLNIGARRYQAVTDFFFEGQIAEVVLYSSQLSVADRNRVESYLALKHGVTLNQTTATNYVASDGTTKVWDATVNATYSNNIAAIGRDDAEGLNQKQSTSVNTGFQPVIGLGTIAATNAANSNTFAADKHYMVWGSSSAATSYGVSYTPTSFSPAGGYFRMARVWKVQETGTVGTVSVQGSDADHLLVSNDPTFATGVTELDLSSGSATVDFSDGQYFTFGANVTAPGGASANLALWLKANAGTSSTTDGAAINLWADQTLLGNDAAQATGSLQPEYTANSGLFNFNPSVDFNPSARLQADISASAPWGSNDGTVYVIYNQETGTLTWRNLVDFGTSALDSNNPQLGMTPSNVIGSWDDNGSLQTDSTFAVVNGETRMAGYDFDNNVLGGQNFHFDGRVANAGALKKIGPTIGNFLNIGGDPQLGEHMLGQIAEVVVYQTQHDAATRQKVQSYLALKYGITLDITDNDGTIIEGDYVTTGGTKAWDKTANSSYHNDVAGIGRDDAEDLYQKQSKSLATDDIITMGIGPVTTSNVANTGVFTSNLSYLIWGNNNASATTTTALNVATCAAPGLSDQRINRVWKVQETGALGKVYVQAALSAGFNADLGVYMMVSTDPTFATYTSVPMTKNGAVYDTSYNFTSGDYFTFAGNTTAPANLCTDGNKYINWWNVGWGYGVKTKTVTQGSQTFTFSFTDASNVLFAPIFYPHQFWNRLYVPRYDNNPTASVQFKMTMSKPALSVQFEVCDVDGWFGGKDVTTFTGFLGGSPVGNPKLSKAKSFFSGWGLTLPAANQAQGNNFWWDCWNPGRVFVNFNQPVDEIRIDYTKNNRYSFKQFNDIQIGSINVQCAAPPPPPNADNIYVSKRAPQGTNLVDEPFTFAFEVENLSCQDQTTTFADTLPAGLTYLGESLITPLSASENSYSGTQSLTLTNLIIPPGKSTLNIDAQGSTAGTYNNQASITVGGNSYLSDDPNQAGSTDSTPVTLVASPFPTADIVVNKSATVATIDQNQIFTYSVQLTNNEATPVTVHFHDLLDGQMTYVAGSLVNPNGGTVQAYAGEAVLDVYTMTLPVGLSTLHMQVNTNSTPYTNVVNVAEVTPQLGSGFLSDRIQSNAVNVLITNTVPSLLIGKSGPATATQGTDFNYTLVVTNTGTAATSGVVTVADTLPAGLSFVSGSGGGFTCSAVGQAVTCTSSSVIAGSNGTATITLTVNPTTTGAKSNTASVVGGGDTSAAASNTVNTTVAAPPPVTATVDKKFSSDNGVTFSDNITVTQGTTLVERIYYNNTSNTAGTAAAIQATLPAGFTLVAGSTINCLNPTAGETVCNDDAGQGGAINESAVWSGQTLAIAPTAGLYGVAVNATADRLEYGRKRYFNLHECTYNQVPNDIFTTNAGFDTQTEWAAGSNTSNTADGAASCGPGQAGNHPFAGGSVQPLDLLGRRYLNLHECMYNQPPNDIFTTNAGFDTQTEWAAGSNTSNTADGAGNCGPGQAGNHPLAASTVRALDLQDNYYINWSECVYNAVPNDIFVTNAQFGGGAPWVAGSNTALTADGGPICGPGEAGNHPYFGGSIRALDYLDTARGTGYIEFQMVANTPGVYTQNASLSGSNFTTQNDSGNITVTGPDLTTAIGQPSPDFTVGVASDVPITVTNSGTGPTTGPITATLTLPAGMSAPATFSDGPWNCTTSGQTVTCTQAGPIAAGGSSTVQVPVTPDASTVGTTPEFNGASETAGESDPGNNDAAPMTPTVAVAAAPVPNLLIGKSGPATAAQNTNFAYTLVVTNTGTAATSGVITVTDSLPAGLSFVSGSGFTCSAVGQVVTCTSSSAIAATNGTASITLTVNPTTTGAKANTASVVGGGDTSAATSNTVNTTVNAAATVPTIISGGGGANAGVSIPENTTVVTTVTASGTAPITYSIVGGADAALFTIDPNTGALTFVAAPDYENPTDSGGDNVYDVIVQASNSAGTDDQAIAVTVTDVSDMTVTLPVKVFLQGPYVQATGLLTDTLRSQNLLPTSSPYTATATANAALFAVTGNDAIVDWVLVEVRDATTPATVVASQSALLQRDGDVVAVNGTGTPTFTLVAGNYHVAVKHRNHLGVMTGSPMAISAATALVDFTTSAGYGTYGQATVAGVYALWMGNTSGDNRIIGAGPNNDRNAILSEVLAAPGNTNHNANYIVTGYSAGDVNLDGRVIAAGPGNDINFILYNIFVHPGNGGAAANYVVQGQAP